MSYSVNEMNVSRPEVNRHPFRRTDRTLRLHIRRGYRACSGNSKDSCQASLRLVVPYMLFSRGRVIPSIGEAYVYLESKKRIVESRA